MGGHKAQKQVSSVLGSLQRTLTRTLYYISLTAAVVVALAAALMCSGSELATILMAVTVFFVGTAVGKKAWVAKDRSAKHDIKVRCIIYLLLHFISSNHRFFHN
jgi:hypothetical protein